MPSERKTSKWFSCFKEDSFDINDPPRSGRPSELDEDLFNTLIHNDPRQCTRELANVMSLSAEVRHRHQRVQLTHRKLHAFTVNLFQNKQM